MTVDHVDLPEDGQPPVDVAAFDKDVRRVLRNPSRYMFLPDFREGLERGELEESYQDSVLENYADRLRFAARLWRANMLRVVKECYCTVSLLCVVKKVDDQGVVRLRLVFDFRSVSSLFLQPP